MEGQLKKLYTLRNKKIILFGTGRVSEIVSYFFPSKIEYYVDNNCEKWGQELNGKPINNPEILKDENKDEVIVLIASTFYKEISIQLDDMYFTEGINYLNGMELYYHIILDQIEKKHRNEFDSARGLRMMLQNGLQNIELLEFKWASYKELIGFMQAGYIIEDQLGENYWGLKGFGYGFVKSKISKLAINCDLKVLDVGGGYSTLGAELTSEYGTESWLADDFGVESRESKWTKGFTREELAEENKSIKYIFERLGKIETSSLPQNYFDVIYSVSALEHIPLEDLPNAFSHMRKLLKKNGVMIHTIDLDAKGFRVWKDFLANCFFYADNLDKVIEVQDLNELESIDSILVEPLNIVYKHYYRGDDILEKNYRRFGSLCLIIKAV